MLNRGVIPMGSAWFEEWSMSAQHTDEDVDRTLEAFEDSLARDRVSDGTRRERP